MGTEIDVTNHILERFLENDGSERPVDSRRRDLHGEFSFRAEAQGSARSSRVQARFWAGFY